MEKKFLSTLLALCLLIGLLPMAAGAAEGITEVRGEEEFIVEGVLKKLTYEVNSENKGTAYTLKLGESMTVSLYDPSQDYEGKEAVLTEIQLNFSPTVENIDEWVGYYIKVTGKAVIAHTAHHLTPVVLVEVKNLSEEAEGDSSQDDGKQEEEKPVDQPFYDVLPNDYFADAVNWAVENSITSGTGGGRFSPEKGCTRAEAVTFLWKSAGRPNSSDIGSFSDVSSGDYYADAVAWAVENGITSGTGGGKFSPNEKCTRAQIMTFLWKTAGSQTAGGGGGFSDVSGSDYYAGAVAWAVENGITSGTGGGKFSPNATCTRGQIVTFLYKCAS